jgi:hypothetical protein
LGATTIGSTGHAPDDNRKHRLLIEIAIDFIVNKITLEEVLLPSGEICDLLKNNSTIFGIETVKQGWSNQNYDARVASSRQNLNAMIATDHEGKTPGSVLCGLVYAPRCALLKKFRVYDAKKNPGGRTEYPENYWNPFFVSPKCGKRLG